MSAENAAMFRDFLAVALRGIVEKHTQGEDWLTYDAPCALYFYASPFADPADPLIAATYAMLAAESLGLANCMLGTIPYCFQYSRALRKKIMHPQQEPGRVDADRGVPRDCLQTGGQAASGQCAVPWLSVGPAKAGFLTSRHCVTAQ
jgi:hypothetical protein